MTTTPPPAPETSPRPSSAPRALLFVGLSLITLVVLAGVVLAAVFLRAGSVEISDDAPAGTRVSVEVPSAAFTFRPSTDGLVHIAAHGTYLGKKPTLTADTTGGVTTIKGGCADQWFGLCSLDVTVTLPAALELTVDGTNGSISASGLTGALSLETTNGAIETTGSEGQIDLRTTNGAIRVQDARSGQVTATTTNGSVDLSFLAAPATVVATSTNGSVTLRVPVDGVSYFVRARTTNGNTDTAAVPSDRTSTRTITAETTNGNVRVVPQ
jgi:hypothetical protein